MHELSKATIRHHIRETLEQIVQTKDSTEMVDRLAYYCESLIDWNTLYSGRLQRIAKAYEGSEIVNFDSYECNHGFSLGECAEECLASTLYKECRHLLSFSIKEPGLIPEYPGVPADLIPPCD